MRLPCLCADFDSSQAASVDKLQFTGLAAGSETNFAAATVAVASFVAAKNAADTAMSENASIIYSFQWVETGTDAAGYLFVNNDGTNSADEIILTGVTALAYTDIITAA